MSTLDRRPEADVAVVDVDVDVDVEVMARSIAM
jgi:hypothetical protein